MQSRIYSGTNTSSIMIEDIASALKAPERLIGLHFFNPVTVLPLVEVIAVLFKPNLHHQGYAVCRAIEKMPVKVKSVKGSW